MRCKRARTVRIWLKRGPLLPPCKKTRQGPFPVPHPRLRLTAVTDDEQLEEVIVVPGHAGSWWLTPALYRFFARLAVGLLRCVKKVTNPQIPPV